MNKPPKYFKKLAFLTSYYRAGAPLLLAQNKRTKHQWCYFDDYDCGGYALWYAHGYKEIHTSSDSCIRHIIGCVNYIMPYTKSEYIDE